jgi:uncharacterized protein
MTHTIIGRTEEKVRLDKILESGQAEFLALYGRRRVGKTFLIRHYLQKHLVFELSGTRDGSMEQQIDNFYQEYLTRSGRSREEPGPSSWQEAFRYLASYLAALPPTDRKHVVFIDEMPWLDTPRSGFIPALEFFWNQHASRLDHVLLVACGSASSWIRRNLIQARGGLYNRVTQRMRLRPFNLREAELYVQSRGVQLPHYQLLELYMAMGGIPFYLREITRGKSSTQLIDEICFSPQGLLYGEYGQLYHSLFRNAEHHIALIEALAARPQGMTRADLGQATRLSEGSLSRALEELAECDFITLFQPFLHRRKEAVYKLTDLYSLFYLKFIEPHRGGSGRTWEKLSREGGYGAWSGYAFENICMMHLDQIKAALGITGVHTEHGAWKFRGDDTLPGAQVDMLIDRADQIIHLCEAKFTRENFAISKPYAAQLRLRKSIFRQATQTKKAVFTTLITTYPALRNKYYLEEVDSEITMDRLFGEV